MAPLSSPYKIGSSSTSAAGPSGYPTRHRSASPLPPLPPKAIDLNSSTRSTDQASGSKITRRAFICDVVVENEGEETANLLSHLGRPLTPPSTLPSASSSTNRPTTPSRHLMSDDEDEAESSRTWSPRKREEMGKRLHALVEELVRTERSYLQRIKALKSAYADPLRSFAKDKYTQIIPLYEAKNLFANIDQVVPASMAFLADLEAMWDSGRGTDRVGDTCLRHLRDPSTFAPYRTYLGKQDEVQKLFQDALKKYSGFSSFIDSTKYQTTGIGNIGLRELLMEPVQRIPRYTLLWQTMIKCMSPMSSQRIKLTEAINIASRIAKCEPDAQTVRATVMYCLQRNVEDFPADLFSSKRDFIDSLDVDDVPVMDYTSPSSLASRPLSSFSTTSASTPSLASIGSSVSSSQLPISPTGQPHASLATLHCTLFLFDDKLIIVKRQSAAVSGRKVTGLDDVARLVKSGGGVAVMDKNGAKKDKLSYRGIVDILDVIASDVGNGDLHLFFERPPVDQTDRWSARPFRSYTAVSPPYSSTLDSVAIRKDKARFIQNLWAAQTVARAKLLPKDIDPPRGLVSEYEVGLEAEGEVFGRARCYWSVWDKRAWSSANKKAKVVLQIDETGSLPDLTLSGETGPVMIFRLQPLDGGLVRLSYATLADEGDERQIINMGDVTDRIATIIHRYGVFKFRTSNASNPATPSNTSHRLRPSMLNLDAISRNLFGSGPASIRSQTSSQDTFGTTTSKLSKGLSRSGTEASRMSTSSDERSKRLSRLSNSSASASERGSTTDVEQEDEEDEEGEDLALPMKGGNPSPYKMSNNGVEMGQSEIDLNERLQLARKNSKSMAALSPRPSRRIDTRSHGELRRGQSEEAAPAPPLSTADMLLASLPLELTIATPSTTAPLRVRNKSPSPSRTLAASTSHASPAPQLPHIPTASPFNVRRAVPPLDASSLGFVSSPPLMEHSAVAGPSTPTPKPVSTPLSPRLLGPRSPGPSGPKSPLLSRSQPPKSPILAPGPQGPRSPLPRPPVIAPLPVPPPGIGSAHTRLRVVSGNGRRVSAGRATIPLKGGSPDPGTTSPNTGSNPDISRTTTPTMLSKRQHSEDHLTPRKRSLTRSPLEPRSTNPADGDIPDPPRIPSSLGKRSPLPNNLGIGLGAHPGSRRPSGTRTPRKSSGAHTPTPAYSYLTPRKGSVASVISAVSALTAHSVASNGTNGTAESAASEDVEMVPAEHPDVVAALSAGVQRVTESKVSAKRLRLEVLALKKSMTKELMREPIRGVGGGGTHGSLPRSPQRRNMNRLLDIDGATDFPAASRHAAAKLELETTVAEERLRGTVAVVERLEANLKAALADLESGRQHVEGVVAVSQRRSAEIEGLRSQVQRAKEQHELLRQQLADTQLEVDTIYEAFNTELDGMFNDAQLPETEAFQTLQQDLRRTKSERNDLRLENMRLRKELEEANLKREQWARVMREHGILPTAH